jgi:hypothetical protein
MEEMMGLGAAQLEAQAIEQDTERGRDWARGWLRGQGMNLKRAEALEAERWKFATKGTIRRWFDEMSGLFSSILPWMVWNMDEVMVAASRDGMVVVTPNQLLFTEKPRRTPHVTVAPCFNNRGDAPPPLLVFPGPVCAMRELEALQARSLWITISSKGWVDRKVFRQWCQWFAEWIAQKRAEWGLPSETPALLVMDNAPTRADLAGLQMLSEMNIILVTLPPHLTHIMQPVDVCWARSFKTAYRRFLRRWIDEDALTRAYSLLGPPARRGPRTKARDSRVSIAFAVADAALSATVALHSSHAFSTTGLVPFDARNPLRSKYVRDCEQDVEREEELKRPQDLHTGSRVLTSPDFMAVLTRRLAPKEVAEAERHALRLERVMGPPEVVGVYDTEVQEMMQEEAEVDLLEPVPADFAKLTAVTERIDPSPPGQGEDS